MNAMHMFIFLSLYFFLILINLTTSKVLDPPPYLPLENIAIDCGSFGSEILSFDGRNWTGDVKSKFSAFNLQRNSTVSTASSFHKSIGIPQVPYKTARLFFSKFTYTFNVTPGPKFIRLHFYPSSYSNLDPSKAFLSVTNGENYTLLRNFSATLAADYNNIRTVFKEFILQVHSKSLHLMFSPSSSDSDAYAFVNGIEIVSMPDHLYIKGEDDVLPFVGYSKLISLDNTSELETVHRINVGGDAVSAKQDSGMFRTWFKDDEYIFGSAVGQLAFDFDLSVRYTSAVPAYTAPALVYQTGRYMGDYYQININYNLSWYFPVETGFNYLVRLHFCELDRNITKENQKVFTIYINNQTAEEQADILIWSEMATGTSEGQGVPVYRDYFVMIPEDNESIIQDLWLELHPNTDPILRSQYYNALLNGVEIFKVNNAGGNLAGPNPPQRQILKVGPYPDTSKPSSKKKKFVVTVCSLAGAALILLILCTIGFWIRAAKKNAEKKRTSHSKSARCRYFTIKEIKVATNNFSESHIIGVGGFGTVYKGCIDGGTTAVAIKRGNQASVGHGLDEFQAEIDSLSQLRHHNVVSLVGYCNDEQEMILVYEYMPNGTLFSHLHAVRDTQKSSLSWNQRMKICAGAAHGLSYLHTGMKHPIVHRDIKTSNILLDENWVAKISDFGLSKIGPTNGSTKVRGSIGYLDPEYCKFHKLTEKSDVYSLGVVLLEVISGKYVVKPAASANDFNEEDEDPESFVEWGLKCNKKEDWKQLIDKNLEGQIAPSSLKVFMEITEKCLAERGQDRPSINEVLCSLELAQNPQLHEHNRDENIVLRSSVNSDMNLGAEFSEIMFPIGR